MKIQQFDIQQMIYADVYQTDWGVRIVLNDGQVFDIDAIVKDSKETGLVIHAKDSLLLELVVSNAIKIRANKEK